MSHYHEAAITRQRENAIWRPLLAQRQAELQERLGAPNVSYSLRNMDSLFARLDRCTTLKEKVQVYDYELACLPKPITPVCGGAPPDDWDGLYPPARSLVPTGVIIVSALAVFIGILFILITRCS